MPPVAGKQDELQQALATHKLLADTCFLMDPNFPTFARDYDAVLRQNRMLIPKKVVQELERIARLKDHRHLLATRAIQSVEAAISGGQAEIRGEASDERTIADHVISRVVEQHLGQHNILILTNDRKLKDWIYLKKRSGCFTTSRSLLVVRFGPQTGRPHIWRSHPPVMPGDNGTLAAPRPTPRPGPRVMNKPPVANPFKRTTALAPDLEVRLAPGEDVGKTGVVYLSGRKPVRLTAKLASGGEGTVFETDQGGLVCKIYHPDKLTVGTQKKIELMVTRQVPDPMICWPTEAVYDAAGVFRGFLMPRADGKPLGHGLFIPTVWLRQHPGWTRRESVGLALTILEKIDLLHRMGVLLGDINPLNILVQDQGKVYFVDCDSYQVEGFPCPVGSINFVAPEIQGQDFRRFLRTREHELFAVATLLFMIVVPGKSPYSHQGGTDGADNIKKMHFPYRLQNKQDKTQGAPEGAWRFCWSHLDRPIRESFFRSFHDSHRGQARVAVGEWIRCFRDYGRILSKDSEVFTGPRPQYGFDLSILPQSKRYLRDKGEAPPTNGETGLQRAVRQMLATAPARASAGPRPQPPAWPTPASAGRGASGHPSPPTAPASAPTPSSGYGGNVQPQTSAGTPSSTGGSGEWYTTPLGLAIAAPFKALAEIISGGVVGAVILAFLLGFLGLLLGSLGGGGSDGLIGGLKWGGIIGAVCGVLGGLVGAANSITQTAEEIYWASGIGIVVGAVLVALLAGSALWAIPGGIVGMMTGLFFWRTNAGEQKAREYMTRWWGS